MTKVFARRFRTIRLPNSTKSGIVFWQGFGEFMGLFKVVAIWF